MIRDNKAARPAMTPAERRKRPEHHVVHDYANLVSSGLLITDRKSNDALLKIAPVNSHVWHAFYMNCRKMYEFFHHQKSKDYLRAQQFVKFITSAEGQKLLADSDDYEYSVGAGAASNVRFCTAAERWGALCSHFFAVSFNASQSSNSRSSQLSSTLHLRATA